MPPLKLALNGQNITIPAVPLTASAFAPFGDVIQNPHPTISPSPSLPQNLSHSAVSANQGSAIKYQHPSVPANHYPSAPSRTPEKPVINLFVCGARSLEHPNSPVPPPISTLLPYTPVVHHGPGLFRVRILERHPFTTQTFSPLASGSHAASTGYLVIVAPSMAPGPQDAGLPVPSADARTPGRGIPDLGALRAFVATGAQAVTYGAGTWHAPMVALGPAGTSVEFVVTQFANGVAEEDCQEVVFGEGQDGSVVVQVPERSGLGGLAKL
ncbi:hypothetical protein ACHAQH_000512 [Verticillium albo-atrum]